MPRSKHPRPDSLVHLGRSAAQPAAARAMVEHLLGGCPSCAATVARSAALVPAAAEPPELYVEAIARAAVAVERRRLELEREAETGGEFMELLLRQPRSRQMLLLRNTERGRTRDLFERLLAASFEVRFDDPKKMVALAELALRVAAELDGEKYGPHLVCDLQARAAAELANALRVADRHDSAMLAMLTAFEVARHGTGDPLLKARLFELASSILRQRRRFDFAELAVRRALRIYLRHGQSHEAGRALVSWSLLEQQRPNLANSIDLLCRGAELIEVWRDRRLAATVVKNLLFGLVDIGRFETARQLLAQCRGIYAELGDRLVDLRLKWLEGRIAAGTGHDVDAEVKFLEVGRGMERAQLPYDASLVRLDLALLYRRQGRFFELRLLVREMLEGFRALRLEREAVAALLVLSDALDQSPPVSIHLITRVRDFLRRLPQEPGLRFEKPPARARAAALGYDEAEE